MCKKRNQEKINKKKKEKQNLKNDEFLDEINKLIDNMETMTGEKVDRKHIIAFTKPSLKDVFFQVLISTLFSFVLLTSLTGLIKWMEFTNIFNALLTIGFIVILEGVLCFFIDAYFTKLVFYTLGLIKVLPFIISLVLAYIFAYNVTFFSIWKIILVALIYAEVRKLFFMILGKKNFKRIR